MIDKRVLNADVAVRDIPDNAILMLGGFGLCGEPAGGEIFIKRTDFLSPLAGRCHH